LLFSLTLIVTCSLTVQVDESLDRLEADILGPDSSPYRGGVFRLNITIPDR
jgi:hypothetical protein